MAREGPGSAQQSLSEESGGINDPGNEDPGSLLDDARVPLQEASGSEAPGADPSD
ncbi:hypothetical protein [Pseudomonas sp. KCJK8993]|uniref:hypothetical protein n=1 Tax=Pseudomonas sp. KCJK8993 TaxID=3344565 RepID=UPI003905A9F5